MSLIIDSHIHHYSEDVLSNIALWADTHREHYWKKLVLGEPNSKSIQGWASTDKLLKDMDEAGVDKVILQGWYWEHQSTCNSQNAFYLRCFKEHPDRFIPFVSVQARDGERGLDDLKKAYEAGACGVGEIFPQAQGFKMDDPVWLQIVEWAVEKGLPINMHVTEPVGHDYLGKIESPLEEYLFLAKRYPELKLILSHWGGLLPFYELNPVVKMSFKNVYYDTAASPLLYDSKIYRLVIEAVGLDKIFFGSDYPLKVFPRKQIEPNFNLAIEEVKKAGLSGTECDQLLGLNIQKFLGEKLAS
ncbi:MAG: amidohydrolase [Verrucomicrobia bacterium]|nr:MAG: amidohydrolase [Verrucomicrobiota bacterium]